jgi:hypothetical protein
MNRATWKIAGRIAGIALVLCSVAFAQEPNPSKTKSTPSSTKKSSKTTVHKSAKSGASKTNATSSAASRKGNKSRKTSRRGQQKIDSERTFQIQQALIKQHYLSGEPTGKWDAATEDALRRLQTDNGWQNKTVPDSRALIKLGLGPNHDHLLNPESAMTTVPETQSGASVRANGSASQTGNHVQPQK